MKPIEIDGQIAGSVFEDDDIRCCVLGNLRPADLDASRPDQMESVLQRMELALMAADMRLTDIVRTWFFIDRILDWYGEFNAVRSRFFRDRNLFAGVLPASTGVGTANSAGAALIADVLAMQSKRGQLDFRGCSLAASMPGNGLSELVQPRGRGLDGRAAVAIRLRHGQHCAGWRYRSCWRC